MYTFGKVDPEIRRLKCTYFKVDLEIGDCVAVHVEESKLKVKKFSESVPEAERCSDLQGLLC